MSIEDRWFRRFSEDFLIMRRMIAAYRSLLKSRHQLLNKSKAVSEDERSGLKPVIKVLEEMAAKISEEAGRRYAAYNRLVEELGIDGNLTAIEALAEVLVFPEWRSWGKTRNYFGLWKRGRRTYHYRSKKASQALERLTMALRGYGIETSRMS